MNKKKKEKNFWRSYFGVTSSNLVPVTIARINWKDQNVTDDDLEFLCTRVRNIHQMDLDNNLITNRGIQNLSQVNKIEELRLKGLNIDDDSIELILKIKGLKLLHIGGTGISCEGISKLRTLSTLEKIICTPAPIDPIALKQIKETLPHCELIVHYNIFEE